MDSHGIDVTTSLPLGLLVELLEKVLVGSVLVVEVSIVVFIAIPVTLLGSFASWHLWCDRFEFV